MKSTFVIEFVFVIAHISDDIMLGPRYLFVNKMPQSFGMTSLIECFFYLFDSVLIRED